MLLGCALVFFPYNYIIAGSITEMVAREATKTAAQLVTAAQQFALLVVDIVIIVDRIAALVEVSADDAALI